MVWAMDGSLLLYISATAAWNIPVIFFCFEKNCEKNQNKINRRDFENLFKKYHYLRNKFLWKKSINQSINGQLHRLHVNSRISLFLTGNIRIIITTSNSTSAPNPPWKSCWSTPFSSAETATTISCTNRRRRWAAQRARKLRLTSGCGLSRPSLLPRKTRLPMEFLIFQLFTEDFFGFSLAGRTTSSWAAIIPCTVWPSTGRLSAWSTSSSRCSKSTVCRPISADTTTIFNISKWPRKIGPRSSLSLERRISSRTPRNTSTLSRRAHCAITGLTRRNSVRILLYLFLIPPGFVHMQFLKFNFKFKAQKPLLTHIIQLRTKHMAPLGGATSKRLDRSKTVWSLTGGAAWRRHVFCLQLHVWCLVSYWWRRLEAPCVLSPAACVLGHFLP